MLISRTVRVLKPNSVRILAQVSWTAEHPQVEGIPLIVVVLELSLFDMPDFGLTNFFEFGLGLCTPQIESIFAGTLRNRF